MTMMFPDVGQYKMQQLKALERAFGKLGKYFDPFEYASMSRKDLQSELHELHSKISQNAKRDKRAGLVKA